MKLKKIDTINVIPFIDIMLVLLVMVLTTSTFIKTGKIEIALPETKNAEKSVSSSEDLEINIQENGNIYIKNELLTIEELSSKIQEIKKEQNILLFIDKKTKFENFVLVMDLSKKLNHENIFIISKQN